MSDRDRPIAFIPIGCALVLLGISLFIVWLEQLRDRARAYLHRYLERSNP